jgi:drug/metabolite transporter (DMT)-like permease
MLGGAPLAGNPWGDVLAFVMTLAYAGLLVVLRRHRHVAMTSAACLSAVLATMVALPLAAPTAVSARDLFYLMLFGASHTGLAFFLLTIGSRLIPAVETALISTLETSLAPVWVWLAFGEVPTGAAVIGGILVLGAVIGHIVAESRAASAPLDLLPGSGAARRESPNG